MSEYTFPLTGPISLECKFGFGTLTVHAVPGLAEALVEATAREADSAALSRLDVSLKGSTLVVSGPRPNSGWFDLPSFIGRRDESDALDITVRVPSGTPVKCGTYRADVTLDGSFGATDLASGTSEVKIGEVDGELRVRSGAGPLDVARITGSLTVKAGASDIRVQQVGSEAELAFGTGSVTIGQIGGAVRARSGSGSVDLGSVRGDVDVVTGAGSLTVGIESGVQAKLDVVTGMGQLHSDLPIAQAPSNGPAISIRARTGRGDVTVRRSAAPTAAAS